MSTSDSQPPPDPIEIPKRWLQYLDGTLPVDEVARLSRQLESDAGLRAECAEVLLLQVQLAEIGREQRSNPIAKDAARPAEPTEAGRLSREQRVAAQAPLPNGCRGVKPAGMRANRRRSIPGWSIALVASVALGIGLSLWFFSAEVGEPVLTEVRGGGVVIERGTESIPAHAGIPLSPGDWIHSSTNGGATITFGREPTRLELGAGSELRLISLAKGKQFEFRVGRLEAEVARQRPFRHLIVTTPNASALVVGTHFVLTAATNRTRLDVSEGRVRLVEAASDRAVMVRAGEYGIVAPAVELAALPQTGAISRTWWTNVTAKTCGELSVGNELSTPPAGHGLSEAFEQSPLEHGQSAVLLRGYLHPPETGDYEFWLAGADDALLALSENERPELGQAIAASSWPVKPRMWDRPKVGGNSQSSPPLRLVAGRRYSIQVTLVSQRPGGHASVAWKRPGAARELLRSNYLSPFESKGENQ